MADSPALSLCFHQSLTSLVRVTESTLGPRTSEGTGDNSDPKLLVEFTLEKISLVKNLGTGIKNFKKANPFHAVIPPQGPSPKGAARGGNRLVCKAVHNNEKVEPKSRKIIT